MSSAPDYAGCRALVLGATGFIGAAIARALQAGGATLTVTARNPEVVDAAAAGLPVGVVRALDACHLDAVGDLVGELAPDVTFNAIGYGVDRSERDESLSERLNCELPQTLAHACSQLPLGAWPGQRLIHLGSALEYGTASGDLREDGPHSPTTLYGKTKLAGTQAVTAAVEAADLQAITARLFTVYGPGEHPGRLLPSLIAARESDAPMPFTAGDQRRDFTYVGDVAEGVLRLAALPGRHASVINLATGELHTVRHFIEEAMRELGLPREQIQFGALKTRPEEMQHDPVRVVRLRTAAGWVPSTTIAQGIRKTLAT